jgi:coproporphyrinogen III oxidase
VTQLSSIALPDGSTSKFEKLSWDRNEGKNGGGNRCGQVDTPLFNRASVNISQVHYDEIETSPALSATALSVILHPRNPYAPSMHFHVSFAELRKTPSYFRMIADLNPSIPDEAATQRFEDSLKQVVPASLFDDGKTFGDKYFYIPALDRYRGVSHMFIPKLEESDMGSEEALQFVKEFAQTTIRTYVSIVQAAMDKTPEPKLAPEDWAAQLAYHTVYFLQVLMYDRGTTHGLLAHKDNDVGTLASLPKTVNVDLLEEWQSQLEEPLSLYLERLREVLPASGAVSDETRAKLAEVCRQYYNEDKSRAAEQAWMDLDWWANRKKQ